MKWTQRRCRTPIAAAPECPGFAARRKADCIDCAERPRNSSPAIGTYAICILILSMRSYRVNFIRHRLNLLRVHWSAKHGPGIRKAHSPTAAHPGQRPQTTSRPRAARYAVPVARLLQALWREDRDLPVGNYVGEDGKRRKLGSRIAERLATNLLSSMPLTFSLLAPWLQSFERASGYLRELLPAFTGNASQLLFEHSPGRGNPKFTADYTAFDALIRYSDGQGRTGFVAFEVKYSESMREPKPELKPRYDELSHAGV
jgi:hypothetical protein